MIITIIFCFIYCNICYLKEHINEELQDSSFDDV